MGRYLMALAIALPGMTGCLQASTVSCGDRTCADSFVCSPRHGYCVVPERLTACETAVDGSACSFPGTPDAVCFDGLCTPRGCGDGVVTAPEDCDADDLAGMTCGDLGYYDAAGLRCTDTCRFDTSECTGFCGDKAINGPEQCEPSDLAGTTCADLGFYYTGGLACTQFCTFDISACTGFCGDGDINGLEQCDGVDLSGADCRTLGFYDAAGLTCTALCGYNATACTGYCGDGEQNGPESCDGAPPGVQCSVFGYATGHVGCTVQCGPDASGCVDYDWALQHRASAGLLAVHAAADGTAYAVGQGGVIARGPGWNEEVSPTAEDLRAVWVFGANSVLAVGSGIFRRDAGGWQQVDAAAGDAVWASSASNVLVVGDTARRRFDGSSWTAVPGDPGALRAVWGVAANDAFAVGDGGVVLRYDGSRWSAMTSPTTDDLMGVWAAAADDVWAVGTGGTAIHFDGTSWQLAPIGATGDLFAIWGSGPGDVHVSAEDRAYHYDGYGWKPVPKGAGGPGLAGGGATAVYSVQSNGDIWRFRGVWVADENKAAPEVTSGTARTAIAGGEWIYDGVTWTNTSPPPSMAGGQWAMSVSEAYVATRDGGVVRWNGTGWLMESVSGGGRELWAMHRDDGGPLFAVGEGGLIATRSGTWTVHTSGVATDLHAVWAGGGVAFAAGAGGVILAYDGANWSPMTSGTTDAVMQLEGTSPTDLYARTAAGEIRRYDGTSWSNMATPATMESISVAGPSDLFAVDADTQRLFHWNGVEWIEVPLPTNARSVTAVFARGPLVVVGGLALHRSTVW